MSRPDLRIPSWLSLSIALALLAVGMWLGRAGWQAWDQSDGYGRLIALVLLLFAGGALLLSAVALMFARSRWIYWAGVLALLGFMAATTSPGNRHAGQPGDAHAARQAPAGAA